MWWYVQCSCATPHLYANSVLKYHTKKFSLILLISAEKGCISWTNKCFGEIKIVPLLSRRSDHVVPQCFSHVLMSNQWRMETVQLSQRKCTCSYTKLGQHSGSSTACSFEFYGYKVLHLSIISGNLKINTNHTCTTLCIVTAHSHLSCIDISN